VAGFGILMIVSYHKINQYGERAASQGRMDPVLAMWVPLIAFCVLIYWMYHVLAHRPGGQPIGALERVFTALASRVRRLLPKPSQA